MVSPSVRPQSSVNEIEKTWRGSWQEVHAISYLEFSKWNRSFWETHPPLHPKTWVILSLEACFQQFIITDCVPVNHLTNDTSLPTGLLNFVLKSCQMKCDMKVWFWSLDLVLMCNLNFSFLFISPKEANVTCLTQILSPWEHSLRHI